jgi:hypothetical protein
MRYPSILVTLTFCLTITIMADESVGKTSFQQVSAWSPYLDFQQDTTIVYGTSDDLQSRIDSWRTQGYRVEFMTGVAWGNYNDFQNGGWDGVEHRDAAQRRRDGSLILHNPNDESNPYYCPTERYRTFLKTKIAQAIDAGAEAIYLEEPEYWAFAGYENAFRAEFRNYYNEQWRPPHESVDARYRADQLKYVLYRDTLRELFDFAKNYAMQHGREVRCYVPTHSLISYAHIQMVSPMCSLMSIPQADGYIAQVWTGTARAPNNFRGVLKERTFESAYFEYAQMTSMVRPTGRTCILLADPIEDDPNHGWDDYEANYKRTLVASLFQPEVSTYEIMPWPSRIFQHNYFATEADARRRNEKDPPLRVPISDGYAKVLLSCFNALAGMEANGKVKWEAGYDRIGVVVSDTLMFQRDEPTPSDRDLGNFFGLAMPLLKHGMPAKVVHLETLSDPNALKGIDVLLLTYEGMKPLSPAYHEVLAKWVRDRGTLLLVDDFKDPYNAVHAWWNTNGNAFPHPAAHLLKLLSLPEKPEPGAHDCGHGKLVYLNASPTQLSKSPGGDRAILDLLNQANVPNLRTQNHLVLRRGSYVVAAAMDESASSDPTTIKGRLVDLFDPTLPVVTDPQIRPGAVRLYRDVDAVQRPCVIASASRIRDEASDGDAFTFRSRGPAGTRCITRIALKAKPKHVTVRQGASLYPLTQEWDEASKTLVLRYDNVANPLLIRCE